MAKVDVLRHSPNLEARAGSTTLAIVSFGQKRVLATPLETNAARHDNPAHFRTAPLMPHHAHCMRNGARTEFPKLGISRVVWRPAPRDSGAGWGRSARWWRSAATRPSSGSAGVFGSESQMPDCRLPVRGGRHTSAVTRRRHDVLAAGQGQERVGQSGLRIDGWRYLPGQPAVLMALGDQARLLPRVGESERCPAGAVARYQLGSQPAL
jgi:hypothetical protein